MLTDLLEDYTLMGIYQKIDRLQLDGQWRTLLVSSFITRWLYSVCVVDE
jgi:hypothetical protein